MILDRSPGIAIPDESFFVPLLARRHRGTVDAARFLDDLGRIPTLAAWGLPPTTWRRAAPGMATGEAIAAVFEAYAASDGKPRWGDKTPMYMRHLAAARAALPDAQYVHLVRDGRDAAVSFLRMPEGTFTRTWAHPESAREFACLWRIEVAGARELGRRVGREPVPRGALRGARLRPGADRARRSASSPAVPFEPAMLEYAGAVDVSEKPHQQRLLQPPTPGVRDWRSELDREDALAFEAVAGRPPRRARLRDARADPARRTAAVALALAWYRARLAAWNAAAAATQRSPLWRRRHPRLTTPASGRPGRGKRAGGR